MSDRFRSFLPALAVITVLCGFAAPAKAQTCAPTWSATQVYVAGNTASLNGVNYRANWWTQGQNPATNNGPYPGSGQPWTNIGACSGAGGCTVIPSVPSGLSSSGVTSSSVNLNWNASTAGANCTIQYNVFRNGVSTYQVSGTSVTASGLAASTTYTFRVSATDQAGTSAQSAQISVTTSASGGGGGGGTGTARSAPYVDISLATGSQVATNAAAAGLPGITLAFLVDGGCTATWARRTRQRVERHLPERDHRQVADRRPRSLRGGR